jgi:PTS system glucitol/sorbitol-specific IIC component
MDGMVNFIDAFQAVFVTSGEVFLSLLTGIVPMVLVLLMVFNTIASLIGPARMERFSRFLARFKVLSYSVLPFIGMFFLCNPMAFSLGKFLPQRQRAGFIDAVSSANGPMLSLFPHWNPAELFVWMGIAQGVQQLGYSTGGLAIRFFISGWVLCIIRGFITERIWVFLAKREGIDVNA